MRSILFMTRAGAGESQSPVTPNTVPQTDVVFVKPSNSRVNGKKGREGGLRRSLSLEEAEAAGGGLR